MISDPYQRKYEDRKRAEDLEGWLAYRAGLRRTYRQRTPESMDNTLWYASHPGAKSAHNAVSYALKVNKLQRPTSCEACGRSCKVHACHWDYVRPLDVLWFCPSCHKHMDTNVLKAAA